MFYTTYRIILDTILSWGSHPKAIWLPSIQIKDIALYSLFWTGAVCIAWWLKKNDSESKYM